MSEIQYKYGEDKAIRALQTYVDSTYSAHYVLDDNVQALDVWKALGIVAAACCATALKYLMRYGKKAGKNNADLLKALHYIILLQYFDGHLKEELPALYSHDLKLVGPREDLDSDNGKHQ
jgi:hypothetical protein